MADLQWSKAIRSFMGYLEGTEKSLNTQKSYLSDLKSLETAVGMPVAKLNRKALIRYSEWMEAQGLKTNSRRRRLLTARRFLGYLSKRGKIKVDFSKSIPAPLKREVIPETIDPETYIKGIEKLPTHTALDLRNRVLLRVLVESGCRVSEAVKLRFEDFKSTKAPGVLFRDPKGAGLERIVPVSQALVREALELEKSVGGDSSQPIFTGYNRYKTTGKPLSDRGAELLVKALSPKLLGAEDKGIQVTPRLLRHSAVLHWHKKGIVQLEIQKRLGLQTDYAFRIYAPLFKSNS